MSVSCVAGVSTFVALQLGLHPGSGSLVGGVTVATLEIEAAVNNGTVPVSVYVAVPPGAMVGVSLMPPIPAAPHELPVEAAHVHVNPPNVSALGNGSETVGDAETLAVELFETVIVYVSALPAT